MHLKPQINDKNRFKLMRDLEAYDPLQYAFTHSLVFEATVATNITIERMRTYYLKRLSIANNSSEEDFLYSTSKRFRETDCNKLAWSDRVVARNIGIIYYNEVTAKRYPVIIDGKKT